jgi:hypothetical protein
VADCGVVDPPVNWDDVVNWFKVGVNGKSLKSALCKMCLGAAVYHLWR